MVETEVWRGSVNAWECDENAHLNVRFWLAKAHEAFHLLAHKAGAKGSVVLDQHIRFLKEARAGTSLYAVGGVSDVHSSGYEAWIELRFSTDHAPAMTVTSRWAADHVDANAAAGLSAAPPPHAAPRSLEEHEPFDGPNRDHAKALGLTRIGLRAVTADYCRGDGRVATDAAIGYISDCVGNFYAIRGADFDARGDEGIGGVALEYRLVHRERPMEGDVVELWSAPTARLGKVGRYVHWLIDGGSGRAWCTAEAIVGFLDLKARKLTEPTPVAAAVYDEAMAPDAFC